MRGTFVHFQTPFQDESQFIVEAIVSDLAEQMTYAASHRLPDSNYFLVTAAENPNSSLDAPIFKLRIRLDPNQKEVATNLIINGSIWSPATYQGVVAQLAQAVGLNPSAVEKNDDTKLLAELTNNSPETIAKEDQNISTALETDFSNAGLHEKAALLLGAFLLRDHSGHFFEIRTPLCRITAHLAMARYLAGAAPVGINGRMAEAILFTLIGDQAPALTQLDAVGTNYPDAAPMIRALHARNTGDYRPLENLNGLTPLECVEWFSARSDYVAVDGAWPKLSNMQQNTIDFVRVACQESYSVEMGHQLLEVALPLELQEIGNIYKIYRHQPLPRNSLAKALNELPEQCFNRETGGAVHVQVIGWGQWALFLQRHLCQAIEQDFQFLQYKWGVPDYAADFAGKCDQAFAGLRLYPFVQRFNCTNEESYHKAMDASLKVTAATPHLVPTPCWVWLYYQPSFAPLYRINSHLDKWLRHSLPPHTVYDLSERLPALTWTNNHPEQDIIAQFEKLHELAPFDCRIGDVLMTHKYHDHPTYDQAMACFQALLPYSITALRWVAYTVADKPDQYEKLMLQAAQLKPACYYDLADYAFDHTNDDKAAKYLDQAAASDPDSVRIANHSIWRVRYCLKNGQTEKARQIAADAGEVYSARGLEAEGIFYEAVSNYDEAFNWYAKEEERYGNSGPLLDFCIGYKNKTGDTRFDAEMQKRMHKLFPQGVKTVSLNDFHEPPTDGIVFTEQSALLTTAGLNKGDVIVAVYGIRVHNKLQYAYGRGVKNTPELDLIVWHNGAYGEFKSSPPDHRFGVQIDNYKPQ